jgi:hypothetical protein
MEMKFFSLLNKQGANSIKQSTYQGGNEIFAPNKNAGDGHGFPF